MEVLHEVVPDKQPAPTAESSTDEDDDAEQDRQEHDVPRVLFPSTPHRKRPHSSALSLTPLWQQVIKYHRLPASLDKDRVFAEVAARLHDPEWEVRQHALRVLVDLIAVLEPRDMAVLVSSGVASETIANLGHAAPAVRQTATEALATQLRRTSDPEDVLRAVVEQGLEGQQQGQGPLGTILALPGLLSRAMQAHPGWAPTPQGVAHLVGALAGRLVQVTYQPHALAAMLALRDALGQGRFNSAVETLPAATRRDFAVLCQVYERSEDQRDDEQGVDWNGNEHVDKGDFSSGESTAGADVAVSVVAVQQGDDAPPGRVVMETEIKFDADTAITMTILEEEQQQQQPPRTTTESTESEDGDEEDSDEDEEDEEDEDLARNTDSNAFVMQVLTDEEDDELDVVPQEALQGLPDTPRRTARRVRFGGEIVKMRTPDSDAAENGDGGRERRERERERERAREREREREAKNGDSQEEDEEDINEVNEAADLQRHQQPQQPQPAAPLANHHDEELENRQRRQQEQELQQEQLLLLQQKLAQQQEMQHQQHQQHIQQKQQESQQPEPQQQQQQQQQLAVESKRVPMQTKSRTASHIPLPVAARRPGAAGGGPAGAPPRAAPRAGPGPRGLAMEVDADPPRSAPLPAPVPRFRPIESLQSSGKPSGPGQQQQAPAAPLDVERYGQPDSSTTQKSPKASGRWAEEGQPAANTQPAQPGPQQRPQPAAADQPAVGGRDSPIPNLDGGESLTCSSSESEFQQLVARERESLSQDQLSGIDRRIVEDLGNKDDWRVQAAALDRLTAQLPQLQASLQVGAGSTALLRLLVTVLAEDSHARTTAACLACLRALLQELAAVPHGQDAVTPVLGVLVPAVCRRVGGCSAVAVKLEAVQAARALVKCVRPGPVVDVILAQSCIGAKSSKMRECALLLLMYVAMTFPSVELDGRWGRVCARVALAARDPRRRVRQAALDALAVLAQFMTAQQMSSALRHAASKQATPMATDAYLAAVQARLARRQLPTVAPNGLILYALQLPASGYRSPQHPSGPDVDWIMAGTGFLSSGSARSREQLVDPTSASREAAGRLSVRPGNPWTDRRWDAPTPIAPTPTHQQRVVIQEEQRPRAVAHGAIPAVGAVGGGGLNGTPAPQYWGPVDNSEHMFFSSYAGMTAAGTRQPLYYRVPHDPHFAPVAGATDKGFSLVGRVHPHSQFVCPYPHAYPYPYPYPHHHHQQHGAVADQEQQHQLSQTWPPRGAVPGADPLAAPFSAAPPPGAAPALPRVLSSPTNRRGRRILDPLPYPTGSAPVQSRSSAGAGSSDASPEQRHKMPPLGPQANGANGADHNHHYYHHLNNSNNHYNHFHLQNGSVERIVHVDDASSRVQAGAVAPGGRSQQRGQPAQKGRPHAQAAGRLPAPRAAALGAGEHSPAATDQDTHHSRDGDSELPHHVLPYKPVVARPTNSPPSQQSASSTTSNAQSITHSARALPSARHPLAPLDTEEPPPRNDSATSSRTSANTTNTANTSSSTISLQNISAPASGQTSGGTSGYHSAAASPGTEARQGQADLADPAGRALALSNGFPADTTVSDFTESVDGAAEDGVDGESHPMGSGRAPDASPPCVASAQPGVVRRVDISPPPKQQSAATRSRAPARPGRGVRVPLRRPRATTPGSLASSGGSASLVGLANGSLSSSLGNSTASLFADTLPGFENPREALNRGLQQLESTEWEVTMQALQTVVRLVRHHPALVQGQLHTCSESLAKQVKNLRSQVARAACQASSHLFCILKRGMDAEAEDLSTALFSRTADTNKFLRADANTALDTMTDNITPSKAVSAIVHKGCRHQNAVVRAAGARLLARLVEKLGVERIMSQPRETRDLLLLTSARLLMEGSLETRSYTKSSLKNLAQDHRLSSILVEIVPSNVMRSIDKTLKSCILRK